MPFRPFAMLLLGTAAALAAVPVDPRGASVAELVALRSADPVSFRNDDLDYLLARRAADNGDLGLAAAAFSESTSHPSLLRTRALLNLAHLARSTGNLTLERLYLMEAAFLTSETSGIVRLAESHFESGNYIETVRLLSETRAGLMTGTGESDKAEARDAAGLLAEALLRSGNTAEARRHFTAILNETLSPERPDDAALSAVKGLDALDKLESAEISASEHLSRAAVYQFNREFGAARAHYQASIAAQPSGLTAAEATFQTGRGYAQETNYVEALHWFERAIERFPETDAAREALLNAASAYARVGRPKEAINRYELFIQKYPLNDRLDRAYLNIVDVLRDQGQDTEALRECQRIRELFKRKTAEATALFSEARIYLANEEWEKAASSLAALSASPAVGAPNVPGGTTRSEVAFLRGYVSEKSGEIKQALDHYLSIPDTATEYYGQRANLRIQALAATGNGSEIIARELKFFEAELAGTPDKHQHAARSILRLTNSGPAADAARRLLSETLPAAIRDHARPKAPALRPHDRELRRDAFDQLVRLGLYDEAADMRAAFAAPSVADREVYKLGERADVVMTLTEPQLNEAVNATSLAAIPRETLSLIYPAPFTEELRKAGEKSGVDPRLILAIMRQESRFRPDARSESAARGLMQFIAPTADRIGKKIDAASLDADDLYSPSMSITLGSEYLRELFGLFPDQPAAVAASYNGGEDNMKRWLNRSRSIEPDRYVAEIQYSQSKDYVFKVISAYHVYQHLYDRDLRPRSE